MNKWISKQEAEMVLRDGLSVLFLMAWFAYEIRDGMQGQEVITLTVPVAALLLIFRLILDIWERISRWKKNGNGSISVLKDTTSEMGKQITDQATKLALIDQKLNQLSEEIRELKQIMMK